MTDFTRSEHQAVIKHLMRYMKVNFTLVQKILKNRQNSLTKKDIEGILYELADVYKEAERHAQTPKD